MKLQFLEAGQIVNTHGIRGEVRVQPRDADPHFLTQFKTFYLDGQPIKPTACHTLGWIIMFLSLASLVYAIVVGKTFEFTIANQFLLSWLFMLCV